MRREGERRVARESGDEDDREETKRWLVAKRPLAAKNCAKDFLFFRFRCERESGKLGLVGKKCNPQYNYITGVRSCRRKLHRQPKKK